MQGAFEMLVNKRQRNDECALTVDTATPDLVVIASSEDGVFRKAG